jgi:predicted nucleic acid-binding protein
MYIALLQEEQSHGRSHFEAMIQIARENFENKNTIITSTITLTEVLPVSLTQSQEEEFLKTFKSTNHTLYDVDYAIAIKARKFRAAFLQHPAGKKLHTPDAIHVATAVIYGVDELHTFDEGLLKLSGNELIDKLIICKPVVDQQNLV